MFGTSAGDSEQPPPNAFDQYNKLDSKGGIYSTSLGQISFTTRLSGQFLTIAFDTEIPISTTIEVLTVFLVVFLDCSLNYAR